MLVLLIMISHEIRERYSKLCEEYKTLHGKMKGLKAQYEAFFERGGQLMQKSQSANDAYLEIKKTYKGGAVQLQDMRKKLLEMGKRTKVFMEGFREFIDDNRKLMDKIHEFQNMIKRAGDDLLKSKSTKKQTGKVLDKLENGFENIKANYEQCREALDEREIGLKAMTAGYEGIVN